MNRLTKYQDASSNETDLSYDIESRLSGITFPNGSPNVTTAVNYDMLGQLLKTDTTQSATDILPITYGYDRNGNRLGMTTGADTTYYTVDAANRLIQEDLNRFVERSLDRFVRGTVSAVDVTGGSLSLIALNDNFSDASLDLDRWFSTYTNNSFTGGVEVRENGALLLTFPRGFCSTLTGYSNGVTNPSPTNGFGLSPNYVWGGIQHRVPLTGDFDLQVTFNDFQGLPNGYTNSALTLMVTNTSMADVLDNGGNSFILMRIDGTPEYESYIVNNGSPTGNTVSTSDTSGMLRIVRSGSTVNTYYWDSSAWQNLGTVTGYVNDTMYVGMVVENFQVFVSASLSDFQSNLTAGQYGTSGTYTSAVFDAGRTATWDSIQWDASVPGGATLSFQIATSSSPTGPFSFVGPDGTAGTTFTSSGTSVHAGTTGRYACYQATLGGNGQVTPTVSRVDLLFAGANTSSEYTYSHDAAGNMTGKVTEVSGSTTVTETRTVNNLNQITANSVVGASTTNWTFDFDTNGNMLSRTNVTLSETTTYTWNEDNKLTEVQLPGGATVSYTYDVLGRMLTRTDSSGTTTFVWDGMGCVQETDHMGNATRYYVVKGFLMTFDRTVSGTTSSYQVHADALGSVRKVTDSSANVVATYDYDAWGNQLASTSDSIPNGGLLYRFVGNSGLRWDAATGIYYVSQRWYDPTLGRFISRDKKHSVNRYKYVDNRPSSSVDLNGLCTVSVGFKELGSIGIYTWYHAFVVTTEPDGSDPTAFRSGPSTNDGGLANIPGAWSGANSQSSQTDRSKSSNAQNSPGSGPCKTGPASFGIFGQIWSDPARDRAPYNSANQDYQQGQPFVTVYSDDSSCANLIASFNNTLNAIN
jgi:RHS repeat-associated protein